MGTGIGRVAANGFIGNRGGTQANNYLVGTSVGNFISDVAQNPNIGNAFISVWNTNNTATGSSAANKIRLPLVANGTYNFIIDWGDGLRSRITSATQILQGETVAVEHTYKAPGIYTLKITGIINGWSHNSTGDRNKILSIKRWGCLKLDPLGLTIDNNFDGANFLQLTNVEDCLTLGAQPSFLRVFGNGTDGVAGNLLQSINRLNEWDFTRATTFNGMFQWATNFNQEIIFYCPNVTSFNAMFYECDNFNSPVTLTSSPSLTLLSAMFQGANTFDSELIITDTSQVTSTANMFQNASAFNQPLSGLNLSACTTLSFMFSQASSFNQPIENWDTRNVTTITNVFDSATNFNQPLSGWNMSACTIMSSVFDTANAFNQNINNWDVSKVTTFANMFSNANAFNSPLSGWVINTSAPVAMNSMFFGCDSFNQNINNWNTSRVTVMSNMFNTTLNFDQPLSGWNLSACTDISGMFSSSAVFNQNINNWDTRNVINMSITFQNNLIYNQPLSGWNTSACTDMGSMFNIARSFNQNINSWDVRKVTDFSNMFTNAFAFNSPLSGWNTSACTIMTGMFQAASSFTQNINSWDVRKVTDFSNMFRNAVVFNSPLSGWNINILAGVNMSNMFLNASSFNNPIGNWDVRRVTTMNAMFQGATEFNQNIGSWRVSGCTDFTNFMSGKTPETFSSTNLDAIYNGWTNVRLSNSEVISFGTAKYTANGVQGRAFLTRPVQNLAISNATNNGSGLIRITSAAQTLVTNNKVLISGVTGTVEANGPWTVTVISTTQVDLSGSTFINPYISGGNMRTGYAWVITDGGLSAITTDVVCSYTLNSVLTDAAALCPTATMVGIDYVAGITGNAARFDAPTDRIDIADTTLLSFTDGVNDIPFSMNMWVYITAFSATANWLFNKRTTITGGDEWQVVIDATGRLLFQKFDKTNSVFFQGVASPVSSFSLNTWYNITVTDNGTKTVAGMKMYIDGVLQVSTDGSVGVYTGMINGTSITRMGQSAWGLLADTAHQGYLEDVSVWKNRVLQQNDVTFLYNSGAGRTYPFP